MTDLSSGISPLSKQPGSRHQSSTSLADHSEGGSKKETYAVSMVTTYDAVKSGVKEAAIVGGTIEKQLREKLSHLSQVWEDRWLCLDKYSVVCTGVYISRIHVLENVFTKFVALAKIV